MSNRPPNLTWLRTFEAAARLLNFTKAARELGLTQTAVSLHIKALEDTLACKLFVRNARNLELTGLGQAYVHAVRKALGDINLATTSLFGAATGQTITVRAPISTAALWILPHLPQFMDQHPGINVRMISTIWTNALADEDVDVDLRLGHGDWPGVQSEQISSETIVPVGAISATAAIAKPDDLSRAPLIHVLGYEDNWSNYFAAHGLRRANGSARYSVDTTVAALALVSSGAGFATILTRFAERQVANGSPIAIAGEPVAFAQSHYLVSSAPQRARKPEAELFSDWLRQIFSERK